LTMALLRPVCAIASIPPRSSSIGKLIRRKEPLNKFYTERVAREIGMIIRRTTKVVAWSTMPRSATQWRPRAWHEGPRGAGIGQRRGCCDRIVGALASRFGVASSSGNHCSALRRRTRFYRNPYGTALCGRAALSGS
jgi:hypothetical protein